MASSLGPETNISPDGQIGWLLSPYGQPSLSVLAGPEVRRRRNFQDCLYVGFAMARVALEETTSTESIVLAPSADYGHLLPPEVARHPSQRWRMIGVSPDTSGVQISRLVDAVREIYLEGVELANETFCDRTQDADFLERERDRLQLVPPGHDRTSGFWLPPQTMPVIG